MWLVWFVLLESSPSFECDESLINCYLTPRVVGSLPKRNNRVRKLSQFEQPVVIWIFPGKILLTVIQMEEPHDQEKPDS